MGGRRRDERGELEGWKMKMGGGGLEQVEG